MSVYVIQQLTVTNSAWGPIVLPFACQAFSIRCDQDVLLLRSNSSDSTTQDTLPQTAQEYVTGSTPIGGAGAIPFYVQAQTKASVTVIAKFMQAPRAVGGV